MATVYIGSARIDERGKASGGQAGNQSGKELSKQPWYDHSKRWYCFRARDGAMSGFIAEGMEKGISNKNIGYDQLQNQTLYKQVKDKGFDPIQATTPCETDCARMVRVCVAYAYERVGLDGSKVPDWYTATLPSLIMGLGTFVKYTDADHCRSSKYLKRGDILCTRTKGHVVVVLNDGELAGGDVADYELGDRILRDGDYGADVVELQTRLKAVGYDPGEIDGEFGRNTESAVKALQTAAEIDVDGEFGPDSLAALVALEGTEDDPDNPVDDPELEIDGPSVQVSGGNAYIRTGPGTQYDAMGVAHAGDVYESANPDGWVPVLIDGRIGWISGKYAEVKA